MNEKTSVKSVFSHNSVFNMALSTRRWDSEASLETDDYILDGYLEKQSSILKTFRKRWIILRNDKCLYSYESRDNLTKPTEILNLSKLKNVSVPIDAKQGEWTFQIGTEDKNKKIRKFKANSEIEMYRWIMSISNVIQENTFIIKINIVDTKKHKFNMAYKMAVIYTDETKIDKDVKSQPEIN